MLKLASVKSPSLNLTLYALAEIEALILTPIFVAVPIEVRT